MPETCRLCEKTVARLRVSHILPKFAVSWLKTTSPGHIRDMRAPNRRIQDFHKAALLCDDCEQRLAVSEKHFAEQAFLPFHKSSGNMFEMPYPLEDTGPRPGHR